MILIKLILVFLAYFVQLTDTTSFPRYGLLFDHPRRTTSEKCITVPDNLWIGECQSEHTDMRKLEAAQAKSGRILRAWSRLSF